MDLNQATQMLKWLDEERRQDKAELARLQEQVRSQAVEISEQAKRIQELEGKLAGTQVHLNKIDRFDDFLQQFKDEIVLLVEKYDRQRRQAEKEARRLRQMDRENQSKALAEIKKELPKLGRLEQELQLRRAEDKRLGEAVLNIQQKLADVAKASELPARKITYLETQREQNAKRIIELQEETGQLLTRSEAQARKLELLENSVRRLESQTPDWQGFQSALEQEQKRLIETQQLNEQQRQRQMESWAEELNEHRQKMEGYTARMQRFTELYEENRKALEALEKFEQGLKRTQSELMELQHLAEQRQKEHLEEWQMENEKRWKKETLSWERQWREQARRDEKLEELLKQVEKQTKWNRSQIVTLFRERAEQTRQQIIELEEQMAQAEEHLVELP
jgi:DNA repair exonuclease SbcCD ATPase subunit